MIVKSKKTLSKKEKPLFNRGYESLRNKVGKGSKYTMSCYCCEYYYQASGDKEEVCQNPGVLPYDMVITETSIYCNRWKLCTSNHSKKGLFKVKDES